MDGMDGEPSDLKFHFSRPDQQTQKRLLFDRRYGWVFDEWKDPAEEAFAGGRGMFCVVPVAKALVKMASHSINCAAESITKNVQHSELTSPTALLEILARPFQDLLSFAGGRNVNSPPFFNGSSAVGWLTSAAAAPASTPSPHHLLLPSPAAVVRLQPAGSTARVPVPPLWRPHG